MIKKGQFVVSPFRYLAQYPKQVNTYRIPLNDYNINILLIFALLKDHVNDAVNPNRQDIYN